MHTALDWATQNVLATLVLVVVVTFLVMTLSSALAPVPKPAEYVPEPCGDKCVTFRQRWEAGHPHNIACS